MPHKWSDKSPCSQGPYIPVERDRVTNKISEICRAFCGDKSPHGEKEIAGGRVGDACVGRWSLPVEVTQVGILQGDLSKHLI